MNVLQSAVLTTAREALSLGYGPLPARHDGSKYVDLSTWKEYEQRLPTEAEVEQFFGSGRDGLLLVCGPVSGGLVLLDFDLWEIARLFGERAREVGLSELFKRVGDTYRERTPRPGLHVLWRCSEPARSLPLARRPKTDAEIAAEIAAGTPSPSRIKTLIETKGAGGLAMIAPSGGRVHPSGRKYRLLDGGLSSIIEITPDEQESLLALARTFDEMPRTEAGPHRAAQPRSPIDELRPGDDFNQRADWADILIGWTAIRTFGNGEVYWRKPGSRHGHHATTGYGGSDLLHVFSTATEFEPDKSYSKFAAFSVLEHHGDFTAAASELRERGFGGENGVVRIRIGSASASGSAAAASHTGTGNDPADAEESPELPAYPTFPLDVLTSQHRALADASSLSTPLIAGAGLGALAGAIGGEVEIEFSSSHIERVIVLIPLVAPRGAGKTPSVTMTFAPFVARVLAGRQAYTAWRQAWKAASPKDRQTFRDPPPQHGRFLRRVTPEALVRELAKTPALVLLPEELSVMMRDFTAYHGAAGASGTDLLLELWNTLVAYDFTRVGQGKGGENDTDLLISRPTLVLCSGIQIARRALLGQDEDGLLARWLPHVAPLPFPRPPRRDPPQAAIDAWAGLINTLIDRREIRRRWQFTAPGLRRLAALRAEWDAICAKDGALGPAAIAMVIKSDTTLQRMIGILAEADLPDLDTPASVTTDRDGKEVRLFDVPLDVIERAQRWFWFCVESMNVLRGGQPMGLTHQDLVLDETCYRIADLAEQQGGQISAYAVKHNEVGGINSRRKLDLVIARYKEIFPTRFVKVQPAGAGRPSPTFLAPKRATSPTRGNP